MKKLFLTAVLSVACFTATAQRGEMKIFSEQPKVDAPEVTKLFQDNFPELGPVEWRNIAPPGSGQFFLVSEAITPEQEDIDQSIRVIGYDDNKDGIMQAAEIRNIGIDAKNQRDKSISESLFIETLPKGWSITKNFRTYDPPTQHPQTGAVMTLGKLQDMKIERVIEADRNFSDVLDAAKGFLHPAPRRHLLSGLIQL